MTSRVLYHLLKDTINPANYSIFNTSWIQSVRIASFTTNLRTLWSTGSRPLEYGWAEATDLKSGLQLKPGSAFHLIGAEDRLFRRTDKKKVVSGACCRIPSKLSNYQDFEHGTTRTIPFTEIQHLAQDYFNDLKKSNCPVILLVFDETLARRVLQELGVDITEWKSSIGELLRPQVLDPLHTMLNSYDKRRNQAILFPMMITSNVNKGLVIARNLHLSTPLDSIEGHVQPKDRSMLCILWIFRPSSSAWHSLEANILPTWRRT